MSIEKIAKMDEDLEGVVEELLWEFDIDTPNIPFTHNFITYIINTLPEEIMYEVAEWGASDTGVREMIFEYIKEKLKNN